MLNVDNSNDNNKCNNSDINICTDRSNNDNNINTNDNANKYDASW